MSITNLLEKSSPTENSQLYYTPSDQYSGGEQQEYLIFMIPGNPGLASFYEQFLSKLHTLLTTCPDSDAARFYILGVSLDGFECLRAPAQHDERPPVGLEDEITFTEELLFQHLEEHRKSTFTGTRPPKVILMGHSVGAYILLELIRQHQASIAKGKADFDLIGGILLFPTITHLAQSPQGKIYDKILHLPKFDQIASFVVRCLFFFVSAHLISTILQFVMRYPKHAATTTAHFIKKPAQIRQALYLAKDEMEIITQDKWSQEVWGAATSSGTNSRDTANSNLILYWGKDDTLVANKTRDELIDARRHRSSKGMVGESQAGGRMIIDKKNIPHAFCLNHSEIMATMVKKWVDQIIENHSRWNMS